jgi:PH (Pleckstrin Homology) domain-containing protein
MSFESDREVTRELASGERLLWTDQPRRGLRLRYSDGFMIPFSLLWGGFAVFWEVSVIRSGGPAFFMLWGVPFVLMGMYITVGRFFADARQRARTYYGLTDQRVVIITGLFRRQVRSLPLRTLQDITLDERGDRSGTISFGGGNPMANWFGGSGWPNTGGQRAPAFELIENARQVHTRIRAAQAAAASLPVGT